MFRKKKTIAPFVFELSRMFAGGTLFAPPPQSIVSKATLSQSVFLRQHGRVVRFCMFKTAFKLGEDVVATLDFSEADVRCVQYSVTLESVETVHERHQQKEQQKPVIRAYNKCHEVRPAGSGDMESVMYVVEYYVLRRLSEEGWTYLTVDVVVEFLMVFCCELF